METPARPAGLPALGALMSTARRMLDGGAQPKLLVQLTAEELLDLVRVTVESALQSALQNHKPAIASSCWANVSEAAKHFKCTGQTIRNWIRLGAPARQIGASRHPQYRIDLVEFEAWVRGRE